MAQDLHGKRATVMGLGLFGGGSAVARFLCRKGMRVTVTDLRSAETLRESLDELRELPIEYRLGEHREQDFVETELVIPNPAVRSDSPYLQLARSHGIPIGSEIDLFLDACPAPSLAVTGTNGKSTTTALAGEILEEAGLYRKIWVGGNIGRSLLDIADEISSKDLIVIEISSFQLEALQPRRAWPKIAIVTRITEDHLDRHGSFEIYVQAKARLLAFQDGEGAAVLNADDPVSEPWKKRCRGHVYLYGCDRGNVRIENDWIVLAEGRSTKPILPLHEIRLLGAFNRENVMGAVAGAIALGAPLPSIRRAVSRFPGLEHRLELLGERDGVRFYNNAVSTTPESTISAIDALPSPIVLIVGGKGKALSLSPLARAMSSKVREVACYGSEGPHFHRTLQEQGNAPALAFETLSQALDALLPRLRPGDSLLFSPAFSSYDQYRNFRERGEEFRRRISAWIGDRGTHAAPARSYKPLVATG